MDLQAKLYSTEVPTTYGRVIVTTSECHFGELRYAETEVTEEVFGNWSFVDSYVHNTPDIKEWEKLHKEIVEKHSPSTLSA